MRPLLAVLLLSACSGGQAYRAEGCEPSGPVSTVVTGQVGAGVSDEGFVTERDIDLIIGIQPSATACR